MQRDPVKMTYGYAQPTRAEQRDQPMSMLEAAIFFGAFSLILDGIGAVIGRIVGISFLPILCLLGLIHIAFVAAAGFVAARYTTTINGVWAGIMVAAINSVFGQMLFAGILPDYRAAITTNAETQQAIPVGVLGIVIVIYVIAGAISTVIFGSFWGFIGAAFSQLSIFRPKDGYDDEY